MKNVSLRIRCPGGQGEVRGDDTHPLVAPYRRALRSGANTGQRLLNLYTHVGDKPILVGTLLLTAGGRLLYFPGGVITVSTEDPRATFDKAVLDHITLEKSTNRSRYSTHVALLDESRTRGLRMRDRIVPGFKVPFFSLLVEDLNGFAAIPRLMTIDFTVSCSDLKDYSRRLMVEGDNVRIPAHVGRSNMPSFMQMDVWVGRTKTEMKSKIRTLPWVYKSDVVVDAPAPQQITLSKVDHWLTSNYGVTIAVSRPQGQLQGDRILRPRLARDGSLHEGREM